MGKPRPRNGRSGQASAGKAPKLKKFKAQPQQQQRSAAEGEGAGGGAPSRKKKKPRSLWGFVGLVAGLASLWLWVAKEKRSRDRRILAAMRRKPLAYTEHGACRMECRFIGKAEVAETLAKGHINDRKSRPSERPCPKYVVDARVGPKGKAVQAVFTDCPDATNVITVIDRDTNWPCPPC